MDKSQYGNLVCEMYYAFDINGNIKHGSSGPSIMLNYCAVDKFFLKMVFSVPQKSC